MYCYPNTLRFKSTIIFIYNEKMSATIKNMSLFIPHVFPNFDQKYVSDAFSEIGDVNRVDFVLKQDRDGKMFNAAYVHFKRWNDIDYAAEIQDQIAEKGSVKFYHDETQYYWIVLPNTTKKHVQFERKPRIDLGDSKTISVKDVETTPAKKLKELICPGAPKKPSYSQIASNIMIAPTLLESQFDEECLELLRAPIEEWDVEASETEAQMAEIEAEMAAEDKNLISIDYRYVQSIEEENAWLHSEIAELRMIMNHRF